MWAYRPQLRRLALFAVAYILGCAFAQSLAIVPETGISIWPPAGLFIATLIVTSGYSWPWWIAAACLAELVSNLVWFHNPLPVALLINAGNALEAVVGAWLVTRTCKRPVRLETLQEVLAFVSLAAGIAPALSATVGSATLAWFDMKPHSFAAAWPMWWIGDATGVLIVAPLALAVFQNWRGEARFSAARWLEAFVVGVILLGVAALSLGGYLPFAYIIMPPLLWAAVRFEYRGAAVSLALLALITAAFTISGDSQFAGAPETQRHRQIMLQLFLAISAFSALVVAAISRQYHQSLLTLRQSQQQLQQMIDTLPVRIWSATPDGAPTYFNKRYQDHFKEVLPSLTPLQASNIQDLVGQLIHPDDASEVERTLRGCLESTSPAVMRFRWLEKDGAYRWAECKVEPRRDESGAVAEWYGVSIDIDDQMRLYNEVQEREARIRRLVESDIIGIVIWDLDGRLIDANDAFLRMVQYDRADLQAGLRWLDMTPPEWQAEHIRNELDELKETGKMQAREKEYFRKDGSRVPVLIGAACFEGQSRQGVAYILDLTERKRAESALHDRECELSQLVDMLPVYIRRLSPEGEPIFFNKRLTDFIGVSLADLGAAGASRLRPAIENFVHPDEVAKVVAALRRALATGEDYTMRYRMRGADGVYRWVETRAEPLRNQDGTIAQWYSVSIDIEDQMRALQAEEALRRASGELAKATQAASLSELSASIAHEVNQPLAAIVANSHACQRWLTAEPPNLERAQTTVERIIRDTNAAAEVVSRIRALFKQSVETRTSTPLGSVLEEARNLIADEAARRRVRIDLDIQSDLPLIALDRIQIQQVLVNLMRNGIEAMEAVADERSLGVRLRRIADSVQTEVSDRGPGVEFPDRIFEPFFTTKEQGMGMGLAICRSIVESHGGRLWVETNEPRGARFIFILPVEVKQHDDE
ncbi:histidine kinase [Bosea sp. Tri-44]|uniref:MASE1 domain-containing protein n=1 Tax=Bosea sp. Tri-44 TaxID=1972137 RepID=UPI00100FA3F1|nr:MASE1 domain-containing protein [Bosea sp. Tri-44]RXT56246.1 histidine kinase [Bosea sp. Tri-44]